MTLFAKLFAKFRFDENMALGATCTIQTFSGDLSIQMFSGVYWNHPVYPSVCVSFCMSECPSTCSCVRLCTKVVDSVKVLGLVCSHI